MIIAIVVIGAGVGYFLFMRPSQPDVPNGDEQPNGDTGVVFTLTSGDQVTIEGLLAEEKPLVIYFFTTWCTTCRSDLLNLNATYPEFQEDISILVVGFDRTEDMDKIEDYKLGRNYPWPFAGYNSDAITEFKIVSQASKVGISLEGEVVFTEGFGVVSVDGWKDLFRELA
jgi:thiol-disulfide isomerase/thioredoxin